MSTWGAIGALLALATSAMFVVSTGAPAHLPPPETAPAGSLLASEIKRPASALPTFVFGNLRGYSPGVGPGTFLNGVAVSIALAPCHGFDNCTIVTTTRTSGTGNWSFSLPIGTYDLFTNHTLRFGGTGILLKVLGPTIGPLDLTAYPYIPYQNASFVLPAWNNLSAYAANCNLALPCITGRPTTPYGSQVPITSWTRDGVYYVNATDELVFYSLANETVQDIAPWMPLYDNLMSYEGIENTEWITADGSYVYEFGCRTVCAANSTVALYAVNITTGRTFGTSLLGVNESNFLQNGQVDLVGEAGNLSIASVISANGVDFGYNLWNRTEWVLATLPFFEANNVYWVPQLESYFDIEAEAHAGDHLVQLRLEGPAPGTTLVPVANTTFATHYATNGVNGLVFNATGRYLTFTAQNGSGSAITSEYSVDPNGTLGTLVHRWGDESSRFGVSPNTTAYPNVESSEHRPTYVSDGPAFAGYWDGWFENRSWMVDPSTGEWFSSNLNFDHVEAGSQFQQTHLSPAALEGLFLNTTYSLIPWSFDCRTPGSGCPVLGTAGRNESPGTVWWTWRSNAPEFPYPSNLSLPVAESTAPGDPAELTVRSDGPSIEVRWTPPNNGTDPLLNYTLFYGTSPTRPDHTLDLSPRSTSATLSGVQPATAYYIRLQAWNLHWHSPGITGSVITAQTFGQLRLSVDPPDATIRIDGAPLSLVGGYISLNLSTGLHIVNASARGYDTTSQGINVTYNGVTELSIHLVGILPVIAGRITPSWGYVALGGTLLPTTGNGSFRVTMSPGTYLLTAWAGGYEGFGPEDLAVSFGDSLNLSIQLEHATGWIAGRIAPATAQVTLMGEPLPTSNGSFRIQLAVGTYWMDVFAPGYRTALIGPVNVSAGLTSWVWVSLKPYEGSWGFSVRPTDANLSVDGVEVPMTLGSATVRLPAGIHSYDVRSPGFDPQFDSLLVLPNSSTYLLIQLNRSLGWITGSVESPSSSISVDGTRVMVGANDSFNVSEEVGLHELVASAPGYAPLVLPVVVTAHASARVVVALVPVRSYASATNPLIVTEWALAASVAAATSVAVVLPRLRRNRDGP